jgi:hypothetical protein
VSERRQPSNSAQPLVCHFDEPGEVELGKGRADAHCVSLALPALCYYFITARTPSSVTLSHAVMLREVSAGRLHAHSPHTLVRHVSDVADVERRERGQVAHSSQSSIRHLLAAAEVERSERRKAASCAHPLVRHLVAPQEAEIFECGQLR